MGRTNRILGDDIGYHVIVRCNNKERLLDGFEDCHRFISVFEHYREQHKFELHAYVIMHTHAHMLITTKEGHHLDEIMHDICSVYTTNYNLRHSRVGHLWISPYYCNVVESDAYALMCLRYIHCNPLCAGMVDSPEKWPWSSHRFYSNGEKVEKIILTAHDSYMALANDDLERRNIYNGFVREKIDFEIERQLFEGKMKVTSRRGKKYFEKVRRSINKKGED